MKDRPTGDAPVPDTQQAPERGPTHPRRRRGGPAARVLAGAALWGPPVAWMAFIFWLSSAPDPEALSPVPFEVEDTVAHMVLYAVLGSLLWRAVRQSSRRSLARQPHWWALGIGWGYGLFDELHQAFVPIRTPDVLDVMVDGLGTAIGIALASAVLSRKTGP